jgi:hypothetical protein
VSEGEPDAQQAAIGWGRALLTGFVVLVVGLTASVGGANVILTRATGLSRDVREWMATVVFLTAVIVVAWALRRLQARGWI